MLYKNSRINVEDLILIYLSAKLQNGYCPFFGKQELFNFLTYIDSKKEIHGLKMNFNYLMNKTIYKHIGKTIDERSHIEIDKYNMVRPTYDFTIYDMCFIDIKKEDLIDINKLINDFLIPYPKRKIIVSNEVTNENIECANMLSALTVEFIWNSYIDEFIDLGLWPKHCTDINKYLIEYDLAELLELPSIRSELLSFYDLFSRRLSGLIQREGNVKVSGNSRNLLAYSNYMCLTKSFENLLSYINNKYFELGIYDKNNYKIKGDNVVDREKARKLVKMLAKVKNYVDN